MPLIIVSIIVTGATRLVSAPALVPQILAEMRARHFDKAAALADEVIVGSGRKSTSKPSAAPTAGSAPVRPTCAGCSSPTTCAARPPSSPGRGIHATHSFAEPAGLAHPKTILPPRFRRTNPKSNPASITRETCLNKTEISSASITTVGTSSAARLRRKACKSKRPIEPLARKRSTEPLSHFCHTSGIFGKNAQKCSQPMAPMLRLWLGHRWVSIRLPGPSASGLAGGIQAPQRAGCA
jgi:hypothetical protein